MSGHNRTTLDQLTEFNQDSFQYRVPSLVFLGLMLPLGILGNASVIYIYGFRLKNTNVHLFITMLAVSDITSCLICIPMEMYRLFVFYNYTSIAACKAEGFFGFAFYICSVLMLFIISVERYVKVCRSMGTQLSRKMAKILAVGVFIVSSLLALPMAVFVSPHEYTLDDGTVVQNCICHIERAPWFYCVAFFAFVLCVFGAMSALYWKVMKTTRSHVMWSQQRRAKSNVDAINDGTQMVRFVADMHILSQTNRTVFFISVVYAASCVPTFTSVMVTKFLTHLKAVNPLDVLLFLGWQLWTLNCTLNPLVYGFLNSKFRTEVSTLLNQNVTRTKSSSEKKSGQSNQTG